METSVVSREEDGVTVELVWRGPAWLGEGPLWHPTEGALYYLDCIRPELHRLDVETGEHKSWMMPALIGSIAPRAKGGLIAALGKGRAAITFDDKWEINIAMEQDILGNIDLRLNDGKCDRQGRFWVGTVAADFDQPDGSLYRLDLDGSVHEMEQKIKVSNGLAWSLDNKTMYYTDSPNREIYTYDFDEKTGNISNRKVFATIAQDAGVPDGLTIDSEGNIWSAHWDGYRVTKYRPDGSVDRVIKMPAQRPTSCMFGGKNLDVLYVTSASRDIGETESLKGELDGALFAKGLPETAFLG
ncbi:SMP30/CGR1 family protein [Acanthamoeba castellanii str. Neff]|uniref:SMP30/CGR1 family protein n=1 Tax=Acanthamoeba castellanii (strain ATCC 30010 / Neff) TaxID=1257118 RepID=L8HF24_ACACF|nr:SMP30/CGR1 family protein [Acanthamoeba castellanii str. Neff]ELR23011.1 SMP30/CGR1 family protein [Acanthamoeba castellanii str. Neff]